MVNVQAGCWIDEGHTIQGWCRLKYSMAIYNFFYKNYNKY